MSFLNLKWVDGDKSLNLELKDYEEDVLKLILNTFMSKKNPSTLDLWKEGYQALMKVEGEDQKEVSEYIAKPEKQQAFDECAATNFKENSNTKILNIDKKQCYYICSCGYKGKHYISAKKTIVNCHRCNDAMMVRPATSKGPEYADDFGNYFIAGEYKKIMKDKEVEDKFWEKYEEKELVTT